MIVLHGTLSVILGSKVDQVRQAWIEAYLNKLLHNNVRKYTQGNIYDFQDDDHLVN